MFCEQKIKIITMIRAYFLKSLISNHNQLLIILSAEPDLIDARDADPHLHFLTCLNTYFYINYG